MSSEPDLELKALLLKHGREPVTLAVLDNTISALQEGLQAAFEKHKAARLVLEQRIKELERTPSLKFQGTYMDTVSYQPGDCATRAGGLWVCVTKTGGAFDHKCWQLAVKKGAAQ